ncbi:MAG: hypothetical protein AB1705_08160 [Verrucomicrobiota bacterium]
MSANKALDAKQAEFDGLEKGSKAAMDNLKKANDMESRYTALQNLAAERFLWAPVLDTIYKCTLPDVEVVRIRVDQKYLVTDAKKPDPKNPKDKGKPGSSKETIKIFVDARDFSKSGESSYDKFKENLTNHQFFKDRLKGPSSIKLDNLSERVTQFDDPSRTFRNFTLQIEFPEKVR